jgi:hypothetical protein
MAGRSNIMTTGKDVKEEQRKRNMFKREAPSPPNMKLFN